MAWPCYIPIVFLTGLPEAILPRLSAVLALYVEQGIRHVLPSLITWPLPQPFKTIVTLPTKFANHLLDEGEPQRRDEVYQNELFRRMNDTMAQSLNGQTASSAMRGFLVK